MDPDCIRCAEKIPLPGVPGFTLAASVFIVCPVCGNKRCPKATDHRLACTGSNESGQPGSDFPTFEGF